jgi:clan AA aspartic protease
VRINANFYELDNSQTFFVAATFPPFLRYTINMKGETMGTVYAEITLKNSGDGIKARDGIIAEQEVRTATLRALVDTGAGTLVINEAVRQKLGLQIEGLRRAELADGAKQVYQVTEPVKIQWKDRTTACPAVVLPEATDVLLGAIPLEDMDLIVDPARQELKGAHGDEVLCLLK